MNSAPDASPPGTAANTAHMPLGARRLVLIGGLAVPVGLVAGPYLFGLQLVAVAGVVAIAVAFSYARGTVSFSRWPRLTAAAGVLWMMITVAYWLSIVAAVDGSAAPSGLPTTLFYAGLAALAVMVCGTVTGWISRARSARPPRGPGTLAQPLT